MDDVYTHVWIRVHVCVRACGGLRLMSENHSGWLAHLIHRGRVSLINPELANMASLPSQPALGIPSFAQLSRQELQSGFHAHLAFCGFLGVQTPVFTFVQQSFPSLSYSPSSHFNLQIVKFHEPLHSAR